MAPRVANRISGVSSATLDTPLAQALPITQVTEIDDSTADFMHTAVFAAENMTTDYIPPPLKHTVQKQATILPHEMALQKFRK